MQLGWRQLPHDGVEPAKHDPFLFFSKIRCGQGLETVRAPDDRLVGERAKNCANYPLITHFH